MKCTIVFGSPRTTGNTAALTAPFARELVSLGWEVEQIDLYDRDINPCVGCMVCQDRLEEFGCVQKDDVAAIFHAMEESQLLVFATPIYAWYCTAPMKALADRVIYAGNKNYGREKGPAMLAGKGIATLVTCGYRPEKGADIWVEGLKRWCKHGQMHYLGAYCRRDYGRAVPFMDDEGEAAVAAFARELHTAYVQEDA